MKKRSKLCFAGILGVLMMLTPNMLLSRVLAGGGGSKLKKYDSASTIWPKTNTYMYMEQIKRTLGEYNIKTLDGLVNKFRYLNFPELKSKTTISKGDLSNRSISPKIAKRMITHGSINDTFFTNSGRNLMCSEFTSWKIKALRHLNEYTCLEYKIYAAQYLYFEVYEEVYMKDIYKCEIFDFNEHNINCLVLKIENDMLEFCFEKTDGSEAIFLL